MLRRPLWLGAGIALGVGGTLWAERRVRRQVRRAAELLSPRVAGSEAVKAARDMGSTVRDALDVARYERRRREAELWRRIDEPGAGPAAGLRAGPGAGRLLAAAPEPLEQGAWARGRGARGTRARGVPRRRR